MKNYLAQKMKYIWKKVNSISESNLKAIFTVWTESAMQ